MADNLNKNGGKNLNAVAAFYLQCTTIGAVLSVFAAAEFLTKVMRGKA